ncbi:hypothetical protein [Runella zeae]|uniref:hypothetical protein n=1 Tax=Runella zeae TaxID=94255 RepID=UPI002356EC34|nr:hypothetical protein [Runella zeae]
MESQPNRIHYNRPQLLARAIDAKDERDVWGRGTGKSQGRLSMRALDMAQQMPRCSFVNVANTYMQLLDRTLPPMLTHWQELGMQRDVDFWVRKFPDKNFGLKMPYIMPETPEHCVFIRANKTDVSVMRLVSQDRPASSSGLSVDGIIGDEARYLNHQKLEDELIPTNRGNERYFKGSHLHHSTCYTSDMPNTPESKWLIEEEKKMDVEGVELVRLIQLKLSKIHSKAFGRGGKYTTSEQSKIKSFEKSLYEIRKDLLYYSEASSLENIHILGEDFIRRMRKQLSPAEFNRAILNIRPTTVEDGFYPYLSERHFYVSIDNSFVDSLIESAYGKGKLTDCRKDADLQHSIPLSVAPDFGGSFNCLTVGQRWGRDFRILKNFYVKNPERVKHLAIDFDKYYKHFYKKEVVFYFDHTHYQTNPVSEKVPKDELISELEARGWRVRPRYIGETPSPFTRHHLWNFGLVGDDDNILRPLFNKYNTEELRNSMQNTQMKRGGRDPWAKNKALERDMKVDQLEAPHLGDAADILYFGANLDAMEHHNVAPDIYVLGRAS